MARCIAAGSMSAGMACCAAERNEARSGAYIYQLKLNLTVFTDSTLINLT